MGTIFTISFAILITVILCGFSLILLAKLFYTKVYLPYKKSSEPITAQEMFSILNTLIETEFTIYETNIFENQGNTLSSSSYENYYNQICYQVLGELSPEFFARASSIMTDQMIATLVSRLVQSYLSHKLATGGTDEPIAPENLL